MGVTLYGEPNPALRQYLEGAGAAVRTVLPYVYAPAADGERVAGLIRQMAAGEGGRDRLHQLRPARARLFDVAAEHGLDDALRAGLDRVLVGRPSARSWKKLYAKKGSE